MTIIEQIKTEVERQIELHDSLASNAESEMIANLEIGAAQALDDLRSFLFTLESEHLADARKTSPKDLEEAAKEYAKAYTDNDNGNGGDDWEDDIRITFQAGAKWDREQMMKGAVEGEIKDFRFVREINYSSTKIEFDSIPELKEGDRVRVVVLPKENSHE